MSNPTDTLTSPTIPSRENGPPRPFTLLRLLAVIAVTGALSALATPTLFPGVR